VEGIRKMVPPWDDCVIILIMSIVGFCATTALVELNHRRK
jgi:hypothetical protein